jgi:hypothetical protein
MKLPALKAGETFYVESGLRRFAFLRQDGVTAVRDWHVARSPFVQVLRAPEGDPRSPSSLAPAPRREGRSVAPWIAFGVGALGVGVGATAAALSLADKNEADRECPAGVCTARGSDLRASGWTKMVIADVGFGVGLAGIATGAVLLLVNRGGSESPAPSRSSGLAVDVTASGVRARF